jgi:hypothetical protein
LWKWPHFVLVEKSKQFKLKMLGESERGIRRGTVTIGGVFERNNGVFLELQVKFV